MATKQFYRFSISSEKGVRKVNEDCGWYGSNSYSQWVAIICDGVGSQNDSQIASQITVDTFKEEFNSRSKINNINLFFKSCLKKIMKKINKVTEEKLNGQKIGTTLVFVFIDKDIVTTFNLGDSRLYLHTFDDDKWFQITVDHNLYNHLQKMCEKNKELNFKVLCQANKNELFSLTNCIESNTEIYKNYDKFVCRIKVGDILMLATDGLYNFIRLNDVTNEIRVSNSFTHVGKKLVETALNNHSNDNVSIILVEAVQDDDRIQ